MHIVHTNLGGGMWGGGESGNLVVIGEGRVMICRRVGKEKRVPSQHSDIGPASDQ